MKGLDTSSKTTGKASEIANQGFQAVGIYLRSDRCTPAMIAELKNAGLQVWSVYERGYPTTDGYFTSKKGAADGAAAAAFAKQQLGQPSGSTIYAAVDYDPNEAAIHGAITGYMTAFKSAATSVGYKTGVYGSGRACRILMAAGLADQGWLTQSTGFAEYKAFKPHAAILQLPRINNSWDGDTIQNPQAAGLW